LNSYDVQRGEIVGKTVCVAPNGQGGKAAVEMQEKQKTSAKKKLGGRKEFGKYLCDQVEFSPWRWTGPPWPLVGGFRIAISKQFFYGGMFVEKNRSHGRL